ncbi:hypothetical protein B0H67DRAFT_265451 [Lasiosphaeris hirsuta]|uniref:Uncharacterized protein n=1 Tax=Lasiosphaeris hirsuta TaxID=260670 RepID=A0AA40A7M1_9PEZI|nr:hypothetical protein B0H67DRAFT_265451 [Lasiosphaeris hirsuta]
MRRRNRSKAGEGLTDETNRREGGRICCWNHWTGPIGLASPCGIPVVGCMTSPSAVVLRWSAVFSGLDRVRPTSCFPESRTRRTCGPSRLRMCRRNGAIAGSNVGMPAAHTRTSPAPGLRSGWQTTDRYHEHEVRNEEYCICTSPKAAGPLKPRSPPIPRPTPRPPDRHLPRQWDARMCTLSLQLDHDGTTASFRSDSFSGGTVPSSRYWCVLWMPCGAGRQGWGGSWSQLFDVVDLACPAADDRAPLIRRVCRWCCATSQAKSSGRNGV